MNGGAESTAAPGWDAIGAAFEAIYRGQEPLHWGTVISWGLGGKEPLDGISAYVRGGDNPHWHFVTYGLSELYAKESTDPAVSGYGIEFTFRLRSKPGEKTPPNWALNFLQNVARYVFQTGNAFRAGDYMDLNSPIALDEDTAICAIMLVQAPEVPPIDTPNGRVEFLQIAGITLDELKAIKAWHTREFAALAAKHMPLLVTDLRRASLMNDPEFAASVAQGIARDGSSTGLLFADRVAWQAGDGPGNRPLHITLGATAAGEAAAVLPGRVPFGRELTLLSSSHAVAFAPGKSCSWTYSEGGSASKVRVTLTPEAANALTQSLQLQQRGLYRIAGFPALTVEVEPSQIKDAQGNVVRVIG